MVKPQGTSSRPRPSSSSESPIDRIRNRPKTAAAVVAALLLLIWFLWPASFSHVENLDSSGSSIVAFGDSLTAGYGAAPGQDYPTRLAAMTGLEIRNAGVSGDTTAAALERLEADALAHDPRIVIVGLGGNDYLQSVPLTTTEANLRTIIRRSQQAGAMVVLLGFRFPSLNTNYEGMYERVAEEEGAHLIPDMLDGILGNPSLKSDSVHPNAAGYEIMAERVEGPLEALVKAADRAR